MIPLYKTYCLFELIPYNFDFEILPSTQIINVHVVRNNGM